MGTQTVLLDYIYPTILVLHLLVLEHTPPRVYAGFRPFILLLIRGCLDVITLLRLVSGVR